MLLSDKAKSIALPMLLCTEADVEGNHSTASGKVDESAVFYIMSRGLSYKEAVRQLVKANFNKIIEGIQDEEVKQKYCKKLIKDYNVLIKLRYIKHIPVFIKGRILKWIIKGFSDF